MTKRTTCRLLPAMGAAVALAITLMPGPKKSALRECLRPATVETVAFPAGCVPTSEAPPRCLLEIVHSQRAFYRLELQQVTTCTLALAAGTAAPDVDALLRANLPAHWKPLYVGCCSYRWGRHVLVLAGTVDGDRVFVTQAALVESRWSYFWSSRSAGRARPGACVCGIRRQQVSKDGAS